MRRDASFPIQRSSRSNHERFLLKMAVALLAATVADASFLRRTRQTNQTEQLAQATLELMQDRLTTPFSTLDHVLEMGYPHSWEPCVMKRIMERKQRQHAAQTSTNSTTNPHPTLNVLVLGGSSAARPGNGCNTPHDPFAGRFSNLLEDYLNNDWQTARYYAPELADQVPNIHFKVTNMAQGAEVSAQGALFLDATIDIDNTDLIVWDYSINDSHKQAGTTEEVRKLDFWLNRVKTLYGDRPPPPIILTYLWAHRAGNQLQKGLIDNLDKHPMTYMGDLLQAYTNLGWDIGVVNVGAAVDSHFLGLANNIRLLFDDALHPGCGGTRFIANLLEYAMLDNLASDCPAYLLGQRLDYVGIPALGEPQWPSSGTRLQDLWVDLFDAQATVGSLSPWAPRVEQQSNLNVSSFHWNESVEYWNETTWPLETMAMHTDSTRQDRKRGYRLPQCHQGTLRGTLDSNLKWLGLALRGPAVRVQINNSTVALQNWQVDQWDYGQPFMTHWIHLENANVVSSYEVSFCHQSTLSDEELRERWYGELPNLQYLIGVSMPISVWET